LERRWIDRKNMDRAGQDSATGMAFGLRALLLGTPSKRLRERFGEKTRVIFVSRASLLRRILNAVQLTFEARRRDGHFAPAYARYMAISGNNFLSNKWRVHSEANAHDAVIRTVDGFAGRLASNLFEEFWPDIKNFAFHRPR
jgi:hypothetical protein